MKITQPGSTPSAQGPAEYFTGRVRIDCPFCGSGNLSAATVTFEPGARTAWHTHPLGQTLLVTAGFGLVGRWGGEVHRMQGVKFQQRNFSLICNSNIRKQQLSTNTVRV